MGKVGADEVQRGQRSPDRITALVRRALRSLHGTPLDWVLVGRPAEAVRRVAFTVRPAEVVAIIEACESAGVRVWLAGGWGVDALVGRQTRRHTDIDLCVEVAGDGEARAVAALASCGYEVTVRRAPSGRLFPVRLVLRNPVGLVVDLLLIRIASPEQGGVGHDTQTGHSAQTDVGGGADAPVPVVSLEDLAEGNVGGRRVACLGAELQLRAHLGYYPKAHDIQDVNLLCDATGLTPPGPYARPSSRRSVRARIRVVVAACARLVRPGSLATAVVVEVPQTAPLLAAVGCPAAIGGSGSMVPHITICFPFVAGGALDLTTSDAVADVARRVSPFTARFGHVSGFPGVVYLPPVPAAPFVALTEMLVARFPDNPPYEGAFDEIIPHLTIAYDLEPDDVADTVAAFLPLEVEVTELAVAVCDRWGRWAIRHRHPLGDGAVPDSPEPTLTESAIDRASP